MPWGDPAGNIRGPAGEPGVVSATSPATYDPDNKTVGVAVGTTAETVAAGNHDHTLPPLTWADLVQGRSTLEAT